MDHASLALDVIRKTLQQGGSQAEVYLEQAETFSVHVRRGRVEVLTQGRVQGLGLRALIEKKMGFACARPLPGEATASLIGDALTAAKASDPDDGNAFSEIAIPPAEDLGIYDPNVERLTTDEKIRLAAALEEKVMEQDPRICESEGAFFVTRIGRTVFANSLGVSSEYASTVTGMSVSVIAEGNGKKWNGHAETEGRFFGSLDSAEDVALRAAQRSVRMLGARKIHSIRAPVVFEPEAASDLLASFFSAVNGDNVNRGASFLAPACGKRIASGLLTVIDDGSLRALSGSRPFDGEGIVPGKNVVVEKGILRAFLYDIKAARTAGARPTGNAGRRYDSLPWIAPNNLYIANGTDAPDAIVRATPSGLYVTRMMGSGFDAATGIFSFGAEGLWIDKGERCFPVNEVTIAGNMKDMLMRIEALGNDLRFRGSFSSPTLKITEMTISGS